MDHNAPSLQLTELAGWGGYPVTPTRLVPLHAPSDLDALRGPRALRGNGRSYGDAAALANGWTVSVLPKNRFLEFNRERGILRAETGVTIGEALQIAVPAGWMLPVVPGTKHATLGGCIASDVHGKNHPEAGTFAQHILSFKLRLADGSDIVCSRESFPEIFWATCGGMGLTGYASEVTLQLRPVESYLLATRSVFCRDLDACIAALAFDPEYPHSAAWLDGFAAGKQLGRSVVLRGRHATAEEARRMPRHSAPSPVSSAARIEIPRGMPGIFLQPFAMRLFNRAHLAAQVRHCSKERTFSTFDPFFFPLDAIGHWNRLYGKRGFVQHQCVLPTAAASEGLHMVLESLHGAGIASFLAVLKATGAEAGPLSFPLPGFTLALDLPRTNPRLPHVLDQIDERIAALGGRVYLAKDGRMRAETFAAMYPRRAEWLKTKKEIDPMNLWQTELSRRLRLCE
jgi:decaprenylphospho-beta-D-ribofuranose 2-oxidase